MTIEVIKFSRSETSFAPMEKEFDSVVSILVSGVWLTPRPGSFRPGGTVLEGLYKGGFVFDALRDGKFVEYVLEPSAIQGWIFETPR